MDLVIEDSGGQNIVAREMGKPDWQPPAAVDAHEVEVFWQELDADGAALGAPQTLGRHGLPATVTIPYNPVSPDRKVRVYAVAYSADNTPDVSSLRDATQATVLFSRPTVSAAGIDEHVPEVTDPPVVSKVSAEELLILIPAPANSATWTDGQIRARNADTLEEVYIWDVLAGPSHRVPQPPMACLFDYNCRNQSDEDAGNGRGVSDWSPTAAAAGLNDGVQPTPATQAMNDFEFDPDDRRAGIVRGIVAE